MGKAIFHHNLVGDLVIDTGIEGAEWSYGLNTANFPTFAGEVVQILSVYIDDLTLSGTVTSYAQMQTIYEYFGSYMQAATQGSTGHVNIADSTSGSAYNVYPVYFSYPERGWFFKLYPKQVPGFYYGRDVVAPQWRITSHVIDDSNDLALIKDGLKALEVQKLADGDTFALVGEISPDQGNPDTDPFQTFTQGLADQQAIIHKYSDFYSSLVSSYMKGDFSALIGAIGSQPVFGKGQGSNPQQGSSVNLPAPSGAGSGGSPKSRQHSVPGHRV